MDPTRLGRILSRGRQVALAGACLAMLITLAYTHYSRDDRETLAQYMDRLEDVHKAYLKDNNIDPGAIQSRSFKNDVLPASELAQPPETIGQTPKAGRKEEPADTNSFGTLFKPPAPAKRENGPVEFPPGGQLVADQKVKIYYPLQRIYAQTGLKVVRTQSHIHLFGAALCEETSDMDVILAPCVFMDTFSRPEDTAEFETALGKTVLFAMDLEFVPWARFSTSYLGCASPGEYRMSVQFGEKPDDTMVSIRIPASSDRVDALTLLEKAQKEPCRGIDIFLPLQGAVQLISAISGAWED